MKQETMRLSDFPSLLQNIRGWEIYEEKKFIYLAILRFKIKALTSAELWWGLHGGWQDKVGSEGERALMVTQEARETGELVPQLFLKWIPFLGMNCDSIPKSMNPNNLRTLY